MRDLSPEELRKLSEPSHRSREGIIEAYPFVLQTALAFVRGLEDIAEGNFEADEASRYAALLLGKIS